jgi:transposase
MEPRVSKRAEEAGDRDTPYIRNGRRREYKDWFKMQVVEECRQPGSSVSIVARRHDINANVLFRWRREYQLGILRPAPGSGGERSFLPAGVISNDGKLVPAPPAKPVKALPAPAPSPARRAGVVELRLSGRVRMIRIQGDVNKDALESVVAIARELA